MPGHFTHIYTVRRVADLMSDPGNRHLRRGGRSARDCRRRPDPAALRPGHKPLGAVCGTRRRRSRPVLLLPGLLQRTAGGGAVPGRHLDAGDGVVLQGGRGEGGRLRAAAAAAARRGQRDLRQDRSHPDRPAEGVEGLRQGLQQDRQEVRGRGRDRPGTSRRSSGATCSTTGIRARWPRTCLPKPSASGRPAAVRRSTTSSWPTRSAGCATSGPTWSRTRSSTSSVGGRSARTTSATT